jgi:hypothetical protein
MYDLETGILITPQCRDMAHVPRLTFARRILEHNIGGLENFDGQGVRAVLADRLEQAGKERGAHDLELERLGVGDLDGGIVVVWPVQPFKIFFMRALQIGFRRDR